MSAAAPPPPFTLSILHQSTVASRRTPGEAIRETMALARHADALGYRRFWMSEHHNSAAHAGTAPEVLAAAISATTPRIRVGTAGVMLPHYAFALHPTANEAAARFHEQVMEVMGWLGNGLPENHPFRMITAHPAGET